MSEQCCSECGHHHGDNGCQTVFEEHGGLQVCECEPIQRYSTPDTEHGRALHCLICGLWCWPDSTDPDWPAVMEHRASCPVGEAERLTADLAAARAAREAAEAEAERVREALTDVRDRVHIQEHGGYIDGATPADQCYRWVCDVVNRALAAGPSAGEGRARG